MKESLFNKVAGLRSATLLKKRLTLAQVFPCEFCEIYKNTFSYRTPPVAASNNMRESEHKRDVEIHNFSECNALWDEIAETLLRLVISSLQHL